MVLYGAPVAQKIFEALRHNLSALEKKNIIPKLTVILVGEDPASLSFVKVKEKQAAHLRIGFELYHFPSSVREIQVTDLLKDLARNPTVHGVVVQLPLPQEFETEKILKLIPPEKDVDGFNGQFVAPTAAAIIKILEFYKISLEDKKILIIGHGRLVGEPLEKALRLKDLKPEVADSGTQNLSSLARQADIIISATGVPELIRPEMVKSQAVIIDAGTAEAQGKMVGDVAPEVYSQVKAYSPVPGGVGPVTVACLFQNVVQAAKVQSSH